MKHRPDDLEQIRNEALKIFNPFLNDLVDPYLKAKLVWLLVEGLSIPQHKIVETTRMSKVNVSRMVNQKQGWGIPGRRKKNQ